MRHLVQRLVVRVLPGAVLGLVVATACREDTTGPAACPEFCPPESVQLVDSTLTQSIVSDSTFAGFVTGDHGPQLQLVDDPAGSNGVTVSRAALRFFAFPGRLTLESGDTTTGPVVAVDSFRLRLSVQRRSTAVAGLELRVYRLPANVDSTVSFVDLDPFFQDSTLIATHAVLDSLTSGTVDVRLPTSSFPAFDADGRVAALGVALRAPAAAFLSLGATEGGAGAQLSRFARVSAGTETVALSDARLPEVDTYAAPPLPAAGPGLLRVGGVPSTRGVFRLALPRRVVDSVEIVRATLVLVPAEPILGAPGDSARILAYGLTADVGAKSPPRAVPDSLLLQSSVSVRVGRTDTVRVDVTDLFRAFQSDSTLPRIVALRVVPEGARFVEARFLPMLAGSGGPALRVTFMPPVDLVFR